MITKILLLGKNGQVGWELQRALQPLGEMLALDSRDGDVSNFAQIATIIDDFQPHVVVNASAYTAVDKAEEERKQADLINHLAVANLAKLCQKTNALLIHYSTDYVFAGNGKTAWSEDNTCQPINYYGQSKRDGEIAIENSGANFMNLRTSWVYGTHGNNFIKTMLTLAKNRTELSIINDQIGTPTNSALIADVTAHIIRHYLQAESKSALHGHYHLTTSGETSWYDYANFIFTSAQQMGVDLAITKVNAIATAEYPTPATRPLNSRLNTKKLQHTFSIHLPDWQQGVAQTLREIIND